MKRAQVATAPHAEQTQRDEHVHVEPIPHVCLLADLARVLKVSTRSIERSLRARTFPIPELPPLDATHRWSGEAVRAFLSSTSDGRRHCRRGRSQKRVAVFGHGAKVTRLPLSGKGGAR